MSDVRQDNGRDEEGMPNSGILAALPRTRPQRASPRRAAAKRVAHGTGASASSGDAANGRAKAKTKAAAPTTAKRRTAATAAKATAKAPASKRPTAQKRASSAKSSQAPPTRARPRPTPRAASKPVEPPAPKQGYEPEDEVELGTTVNPPSGVELVESVADIVGEIAGAGLTAGGRLLKDALSLLRFP